VEDGQGYGSDVAFIHDAAFGDWAAEGSAALIDRLSRDGVDSGLVVDLGCGSGLSAAALTEAGYAVFGVDQSAAMIELARRRVPSAEFQCASVLDVELPACRAVVAIGEVFNYLFDGRVDPESLEALFGRVFDALLPGGIFLFDVARAGRVPEGRSAGFKRTPDWAILYESFEEGATLTRQITTFRRRGDSFARTDETHRLCLHVPFRISSALLARGFEVEVGDRFGEALLAPGLAVFVARKPG
jgi:SAM-dependent methyltransferase